MQHMPFLTASEYVPFWKQIETSTMELRAKVHSELNFPETIKPYIHLVSFLSNVMVDGGYFRSGPIKAHDLKILIIFVFFFN